MIINIYFLNVDILIGKKVDDKIDGIYIIIVFCY